MYGYLQVFRQKYELAERSGAALPKWLPPPPTLGEGIATMLDVIEENLATDAARANLARCFQDVGLAPLAGGDYYKYTSHAGVTLRVTHVQKIAAGSVAKEDQVDMVDLLLASADVEEQDEPEYLEIGPEVRVGIDNGADDEGADVEAV